MTSHERVMAALDHRRPDRPPLNYFGTQETTDKLLVHLGLQTHEQLLCYFGADMRYVTAHYVGPSAFSGTSGYSSGGTDMWGATWTPVSNMFATYYEVVHHPLASATTVKEIRAHPWPSPDWLDVSHVKDQIAQINRDERRAIVFPVGPFFETAWSLRGLEQFLMDMLEQPEIADYILGKVTMLMREVTMRAAEAAHGQIDIIWSASDVGIQTGMFCSPQLWRQRIKPWHRHHVEPFKQMGLRTRYHTDGAIAPIIDDLIEMGVDLLDPIQPKAAGMDAESLHRQFGGRISFYGGIDTQSLMPYGTARQVEAEVIRLIELLGAEGGYVVAASNAVQPDVPIENILALYCTARDYRYSREPVRSCRRASSNRSE